MTTDTTGLSAPAARAADIFRRYPAISPDEEREALTFLKKGRHLDVGLVTGNPDVEADQSLLVRMGMHTTRAHA